MNKKEEWGQVQLEENCTLIRNAYVVLIIAALIMTVINLAGGNLVSGMGVFLLFLGFLICYLMQVVWKLTVASVVVFEILISVSFTWFFFMDCNKGYSILWLLLLPFAVMTIINVRIGSYISMYFLILFVAFCYTPLCEFVPRDYDRDLLFRFPIVYGFSISIAYITGKKIQSIREMKRRIELEEKQAVLEERQRNASMAMDTVVFIGRVVDAKDPYTSEHSQRVAEYAGLIAKELGFDEKEQKRISNCGLVHDIGKIGIPDEVLKKRTKLTKEEYEVVKTHTVIGYNMIKDYDLLREDLSDGILYHHERYDGKGYPSGLSGEDIPIAARIISVADAFDAMNSKRGYRQKLDRVCIMQEFQECSGKQFDPKICDIFLRMLYDKKI